jgi:hypothetical protein
LLSPVARTALPQDRAVLGGLMAESESAYFEVSFIFRPEIHDSGFAARSTAHLAARRRTMD